MDDAAKRLRELGERFLHGSWTPERFHSDAFELYRAQRDAIPVYDAWCEHELDRRGTGPTVSCWEEVPALPVAAFRTMDVAAEHLEVVATWESSGTSGDDRSRHLLHDLAQYEHAIDCGIARALLPDVVGGERPPLACVQLQPSAAAAPSSSLSHMFDWIRSGPWCIDRGAYVDADYKLDSLPAWSQLEQCMADDEPVLVLTTSFALAMLLDAAEDASWETLQLPPGSRVVDTGGFKGRTRELSRSELEERLRRLLGIEPEWYENEYGMSELSSQSWLGTVAAACGHPLVQPGSAPGSRWSPPWVRVRVVDPVTLDEVADGESGLLVFHDLANVWSCACVRSEDLGIRRGQSFELLGRAPGATLKGCSLRLEDLHVTS